SPDPASHPAALRMGGPWPPPPARIPPPEIYAETVAAAAAASDTPCSIPLKAGSPRGPRRCHTRPRREYLSLHAPVPRAPSAPTSTAALPQPSMSSCPSAARTIAFPIALRHRVIGGSTPTASDAAGYPRA